MKRFFALSALALGSASAFGVLVFDSATGATTTFTTSTPHNMMATGLSLGNVPNGPVRITGMDLAYTSQTAATYTNIRVDITFFDVSTGATSGSDPAFTNPLASYFFNTGPVTRNASTSYVIQGATPGVTPGLNFATGFTFSDPNNVGVQFLIRGDFGNGLENTQNLTWRLRHTAPPAVGTFTVGAPGVNGYYRNVSNPNPTSSADSLLGSDFRSLANTNLNQGLWLRMYGNPVPEPATILVLGGAAAMFARRRRN